MPILPNDFYIYWKDYLKLNSDLNQNCSYNEAKHHYIKYGYYENRKYKDDCSENDNNEIETTMKESNIHLLIVIVSCNKHAHFWYKLQRRTKNRFIIITGSNKNENWYDKKSNILYLKCNDLYDGLPEKIIMMIEQVLKIPEFNDITHIVKIDDHDTFFNDKVIKNLYEKDELHVYDYLGQKKNFWQPGAVGNYHFGKVPRLSYWYNRLADITNVTYFDGGCSYILSRKAMEIINQTYNSSNIQKLRINEIYEDLMIGRIMQNNNIEAYEMDYGLLGDK
jgi:hypothetical protein